MADTELGEWLDGLNEVDGDLLGRGQIRGTLVQFRMQCIQRCNIQSGRNTHSGAQGSEAHHDQLVLALLHRQVESRVHLGRGDAHALGGGIVRPASGVQAFPASVLDRKLFSKEGDLGRRLLELSAESATAGGAATAVAQDDAGQRDGVQDARFDVPPPLPG